MARKGWTARTRNAMIQGSNDGKTWTTLCQFDREGIAGQFLTVKKFSSNTGYSMYRYINEQDQGDIAELRFYGRPAEP